MTTPDDPACVCTGRIDCPCRVDGERTCECADPVPETVRADAGNGTGAEEKR